MFYLIKNNDIAFMLPGIYLKSIYYSSDFELERLRLVFQRKNLFWLWRKLFW